MSSWAVTPEDHLINAYLETNSGELFLEVEVGGRGGARPRRIDGVSGQGLSWVFHEGPFFILSDHPTKPVGEAELPAVDGDHEEGGGRSLHPSR